MSTLANPAEMISGPLGIICALPDEAAAFRASAGQGQVVRVEAGLLCVISGAGACRAAAAAAKLVEEGARALLSWGFAGALSAALKPGRLVLPQTIRAIHGDHDEIWQVDPVLWRQLHDLASPALSPFTGELLCAEDIVRTAAKKKALFEARGYPAVDMESAGIMRAARDAGIPAMTIRAIVDANKMTIPDYIDADTGLLGILKGVVGRPSSIPSVIALAAGYRRANATLKQMALKLLT